MSGNGKFVGNLCKKCDNVPYLDFVTVIEENARRFMRDDQGAILQERQLCSYFRWHYNNDNILYLWVQYYNPRRFMSNCL